MAGQIAETSNFLAELSRDDLLSVASALAESGIDGERLERLAKLARKASSLTGPETPMGYHY